MLKDEFFKTLKPICQKNKLFEETGKKRYGKRVKKLAARTVLKHHRKEHHAKG
jgi:hypothetical protein